MKHLAIIFAVGMLLLSSTIHLTVATSYTNITVIDAKALIESNPSLVILDVRTQSEYDSGHIRLAIHIPLDELSGRLDELNTTDEILVYCKAGGRSASASQILVDNSFLYIFNMLGGIDEWKIQGYPVYVKYSSIQEAINNANEEDTIYVSAGTYYENVVVNKTVSLIGEDKHSTIVDGNLSGTVVTVLTNNVNITGFTVRKSQQLGAFINSGIYVSGNSSNINNNILTDNLSGLCLHYSNSHTVSSNTALQNYLGIYLDHSSNSTVSGNSASNNSDGIELVLFCHNNIVSNNTFSNNDDYGIILEYECHNNSLFDNTVSNNNDTGILLVTSNNNTIFHNNFVNNTQQTYIVDSTSIWDDSCEGNFWSDFAGSDSNGDGIGDTPYIIDGNNQDNYPLMNIYWNPGDINHDLEVDIYDVVLACVAYSSTPIDSNWNCHCDIAEPYGIINIFDIVMICSSYGEEYTP